MDDAENLPKIHNADKGTAIRLYVWGNNQGLQQLPRCKTLEGDTLTLGSAHHAGSSSGTQTRAQAQAKAVYCSEEFMRAPTPTNNKAH